MDHDLFSCTSATYQCSQTTERLNIDKLRVKREEEERGSLKVGKMEESGETVNEVMMEMSPPDTAD